MNFNLPMPMRLYAKFYLSLIYKNISVPCHFLYRHFNKQIASNFYPFQVFTLDRSEVVSLTVPSTNTWINKIGRKNMVEPNTVTATLIQIKNAAKEIYSGYDEILEALGL